VRLLPIAGRIQIVVKLLDSLLDAIVRLEGDALVMHVGEKPYVITTSAAMNAYRGPLAWGQVELSSRVLTFDAVSSMLAQILPVDQQRALDELGAIEHEILPPDGILDRFTVVAARGGEDVWVEVRRKPTPAATPDIAEPVAEEPPDRAQGTTPDAPPQMTQPAATDTPPVDSSTSPVTHVESIVVALPGEEHAELALDHEAERAIQLVDDEPQRAPTEADVDAMLAANASALLNLSADVDVPIEIEGPPEAVSIAADEVTPDELESIDADASVEIDLDSLAGIGESSPFAPPVSDLVAAHDDAVPEFALSPPTETDDQSATESIEPVHEAPPGTPLFSDAAIAAAAAPEPIAPLPALASTDHVEAAPSVAEISLDDLAGTAPPVRIESTSEADVPPVLAIDDVRIDEPALPAAEDLEAYAAVWSNALHEWASRPTRAETFPDRSAMAPLPSPPVVPSPEMPSMEVTPEPRHSDAGAINPHAAAADTPAAPSAPVEGSDQPDADTRSGVVVSLSRSALKPESIAAPFTPSEDAALMRTLRVAAARGAATVYVVAQSKPMIRVDGDIVPLDTEPVLAAADVDRLVLELVPPRRRDALQSGPLEWLCDIPEIGRVRCVTFRDHRGPGVLFRMIPPRAISADQLALTPEVQALCQQSDGLVLVAGGRASGKSTLLNAFVDLINRTRSDHVITVESQIGFVHESRKSFISQRETRGDADLAASIVRSGLREDPDVMMIEELKSADLASAALDAAESGRLVLASVPASSTVSALERLIELLPAERRVKGRASLATSLRGVVAQLLLRRSTGGRIAAREILLNTPAVSSLVLEGKLFQLPVALDGGRRLGMIPLTDSLAAHVREGTVNAGEAYRKALDRAALVAALKRDGVDTSFAERMA
jgi:twitching motility protein PilT